MRFPGDHVGGWALCEAGSHWVTQASLSLLLLCLSPGDSCAQKLPVVLAFTPAWHFVLTRFALKAKYRGRAKYCDFAGTP